jgi:hypothetical protein
MLHCKDCAWFLPLQTMPEAQTMHDKLHELFDDVLESRDGETGICRKVTFSMERPVLTREDGFCHRAEPKEDSE